MSKRNVLLRSRVIGGNQRELILSSTFGLERFQSSRYFMEKIFYWVNIRTLDLSYPSFTPRNLRTFFNLTASACLQGAGEKEMSVIYETTSRKVKFLKENDNSRVTWRDLKDMCRGFRVKQLMKQIQETSLFVLDNKPKNWVGILIRRSDL